MNIIELSSPVNKNVINKYMARDTQNHMKYTVDVINIIQSVINKGDSALYDFTYKFDKVDIDSIRVSEAEKKEALCKVDKNFIEILLEAKENIKRFHEKQMENTWLLNEQQGITLGQLINPLERIGIYVPGGKASYPSTVLMNAIPALVAGVESIAMVTPPNMEGKVNPYILAAAHVSGVDEIYKVGGAQAIAALAYGTESIAPVDKIVGPGNIYVALAKKEVFGKVDIDMIAGPSEICIIADEDSNPEFIAADLLSQAEHDEMAKSILVTTSKSLSDKVITEVNLQMKDLNRKEIIKKSIETYGQIFIVENIDTAFDLANMIAPEHLELMVENPLNHLDKVKNAGAVFLGSYSPEPIGDYFAGPNHTLPTSGTSKFSSPLGVYDFIKRSSIIYYDKPSLKSVMNKVTTFANLEGLDAHANAIKRRFRNE